MEVVPEMASKKKTFIKLTIALVMIALILWIAWGNTALELNTYTISWSDLPEAFVGYRIAHVSDLHNAEIGENNADLIAMLQEAKPDMIAITGDFIDSRDPDVAIALQFTQEALKIAPCYYVTGNQEPRVPEYADLKKGLEELGVPVLENERMELEYNGDTVTLLGVDDPSFETDYQTGDAAGVTKTHLQELTDDNDSFTILLSHRPELFEVYTEYDMDLVLTGHAHGGQVRLPFVGGLIAPNQGWFPEYQAGLYTEENTNMMVSRGIGNSIFPFRFNNRPEVILIELQKS